MKSLLFSLGLLLFSSSFLPLYAQQTLKGAVTDADDGSPMPGVNILLKGTGTGTITNVEGNYTLQVPQDEGILVFSFIGFRTREVPFQGSSTIDVALEIKQLQEVVVTGYATQQKKDVTGAISSIEPKSFKEINIQGVDQALQGQAPGVMVTKSSGTPGGGIMVRIRGNSSIDGSNTPLYIIDGVPVSSGSLTGRSFGGQSDNQLALLNPNDIESIQILKDAHAKAIYGARGANGVVVITTKRGESERTSFNINVQRGVSQMGNKLDLLNSSELLELHREALRNAEQNPDNAGLPGITDAIDTDWVDEITRLGILQEYQLSLTGGSDNTRFYLSGSYRDEEGVQLGSRFQRYSATLNVEHDINEDLNIGLNLILSRGRNNLVKGDNFLDGVYSGALKSLPYYQPYQEDGSFYAPGDVGYASFPNFNPVGQALIPRFLTLSGKVVGGIFADYTVIPGLNVRSKVSLNYTTVIEDQYESTETAIGGFLFDDGLGVYSTSEAATINITNTATYSFSFLENHHVNALLGNEIVQNQSRSSNVQGFGFPSDDFSYLTSAGVIFSGSSFFIESGLVSYFTGVNYDFKGKYLAGVNLRYDGSSRFGENQQYGLFPSLSLGWRVSDEAFFPTNLNIDDLKLRASYGLVGNQGIPSFAFLGTWGASTAYNLVPAIVPFTLSNPNLQWEETAELNLGLDFSILQGRFQGTLDVYNNVTTDLFLSEQLPLTTGFGSVQGNSGEVTNRGIEFALNSVNIDGPVTWRTNFNISANRNEVVSLAAEEPQFSGYNTFTNRTHAIRPGQPLGTFWGLEFLGVDPATGDAIYQDLNNDGQITANDGQVIGNAQPDFVGGITNTFSWNGFEVSAFFQYSIGNEMINFTNQGMLNAGESLDDNQVSRALDRWQEPGDITDVPRYEQGNTFNNYFSSRLVEDASYVRLKNLSLGYNLPREILDIIKFQRLKVFLSATNLLTFTNYSGADPEVNTLDGSTTAQGMDFYTFPQVRTVSVGLNADF